MHSMVLIASRPLEINDEIYMDYRLSPGKGNTQLPSWYTPYDLESSKRRWNELDSGSGTAIENSNGNSNNS
jgi:hypothetical protein